MKSYQASFDPISLKDAQWLRRASKKEKIQLTCTQKGILDTAYRLDLLRLVFVGNKNIEILVDLEEAIAYECQDEEKIQEGKFYLAPACIRENLVHHFAFAKEILQARLKPNRVAHSYSVAQVCQELALRHRLDPKKAYLMGLWHDISKDESQQEEKMQRYYPKETVPSWARHGYLGAHWLKENLGIQDLDILRAIQRHALGDKGKSAYDYLLFVADKIEPLRNYDTKQEMALAKLDLKKAAQLVLQQQRLFLERK